MRSSISASIAAFGLILILSGIHAFAEDLPVMTTVYCRDTSLSQVFESCEEVQVIKQIGNRVQAYSRPKQQVLNLKPENIFVARLAAEGEKILAGDHVTINSTRIWNSSQTGFMGICKVGSVTGNMLKVSCGRYRDEKISRESVYLLKPFETATQRSSRQ